MDRQANTARCVAELSDPKYIALIRGIDAAQDSWEDALKRFNEAQFRILANTPCVRPDGIVILGAIKELNEARLLTDLAIEDMLNASARISLGIRELDMLEAMDEAAHLDELARIADAERDAMHHYGEVCDAAWQEQQATDDEDCERFACFD